MLHNKRLGFSYDINSVDASTTVTASRAVPTGVRYIRVISSGYSRIRIDPNGLPSVAGDSTQLGQHFPEVFCVNAGDVVSIVDGPGVTVNVTELL